MAIDTATPRTRRTVIAAGLGGLAAFAANALGRPAPLRAGSDGDVVLGANNVATSTTQVSIYNGTFADSALMGYTLGSGAGVWGGSSGNGAGVHGECAFGDGVVGSSNAATHSGVWGQNTGGGYGVAGSTGGSTTAGVWGSNSGSGIGVRASSASGNALKVEGKAAFSRSGRASVHANASYVDVTVPGGLTSSANVLALLQASRSGVWVRAVRTNYPSSGKVRIYLNKVASTTLTTPVAWFVLN